MPTCDRCKRDLSHEHHQITVARMRGDECLTVPKLLRLCSACLLESGLLWLLGSRPED